MADEENQVEDPEDARASEGQDGEKRSKLGKGPMKLLLAVVLVIATGGALSIMAVPGKARVYKLEGPYFAGLFEEPVTVTVVDNNATRYLKFQVDAEFVAYEARYVESRVGDPFYEPYKRSVAETVASSRTLSETVLGPQRERFAAALRDGLEPVVFPVHIGASKNPLDRDKDSGLQPGISHADATFRGLFHDHVLVIDGPSGVIQLDDGPEITFMGNEEDLEVRAANGAVLYVDLTHFDPEFTGTVKVGVHGKLRRLLLTAIGQ